LGKPYLIVLDHADAVKHQETVVWIALIVNALEWLHDVLLESKPAVGRHDKSTRKTTTVTGSAHWGKPSASETKYIFNAHM
jgi:hypothetical protein